VISPPKHQKQGYSVYNDNGVAVVAHERLRQRKPVVRVTLPSQRKHEEHSENHGHTHLSVSPQEIQSIVLSFAHAIQEAQRQEFLMALDSLSPENPGRITLVTEGFGEDIQQLIDERSKQTGKLFYVRKQTFKRPDGIYTQFIISHDFLIPHGDHYHRASSTVQHADYLMLVMVVACVAAFAGIAFWKRVHPESYELAVLAGLWLIPAYVAVNARYYRFLSFWFIFSCVSMRLLYLATRRPIAGSTPRYIYSWFMHTYNLAYYVALVGGIMAFLPLLGIDLPGSATASTASPIEDTTQLGEESAVKAHVSIAYYGFLLLFYGLYFGVLCRDTASVCISWIVMAMGRASDVTHEDLEAQQQVPGSDPSSKPHDSLDRVDPRERDAPKAKPKYTLEAKRGMCALCGYALRSQTSSHPNSVPMTHPTSRLGSAIQNLDKDFDDEASDTQLLSETRRSVNQDDPDVDVEIASSSTTIVKKDVDPRDEKVYKLPCKHSFHEFCLRGWLLVGKRDTCPSCHESCPAREHFNRSPREIQSLVWSQLLDWLRFVLVINPALIFFARLALRVAY